jgi:Fe-S-cluster-containing dehydrogenase component
MKVLWVSKTLKRQEAELSELPENETILMVDLDRCISCGACHFACE